MIKLKPIEKKILQELRKNSRIKIADISRDIDVPMATVFNKSKYLERNLIKRYTTLIHFDKIKHTVTAHFAVKAKNKKILKNFLKNNKNINNLFLSGRGFDFYFECIFKDMNRMSEFKEKIEEIGIKRIDSYIILDEITKEKLLS